MKQICVNLSSFKTFSKRNELSFSYQALGVCLSPYNALLSLKHVEEEFHFQIQKVVQHTLPIGLSHLQIHFLHPFDAISYYYRPQIKVRCVLLLNVQQVQRFLCSLYLPIVSNLYQLSLPCFSQPYPLRPACCEIPILLHFPSFLVVFR